MSWPSPAQRAGWFAQNHEGTHFGGLPHNLHRLATTADGTEWVCRCRHADTAPTADDAVAAHKAHAAQATPGATL